MAVRALDETIYGVRPTFARGSFDTAITFHRATGLAEHPPTYEQIVPPSLRTGG